MAKNEIKTKIREAYDLEYYWSYYDPVLLTGQLAYSSDKYGKYKIGDGTKRWSQLNYVGTSWGDITGKPSSFTPSSHTHTINQITDIGNASVKYATTADSANSVAWNNVSEKPSTFAPSTHSHSASQITGLPTKLSNPYSLTIKGNGTLINTYDGSYPKEINITPVSIGAANATHYHYDYAPTNHSHNIINDFSPDADNAVSISTFTNITATSAGSFDFVVANTTKYGQNKCVVVSKASMIDDIAKHTISTIPLKAITNNQIDSLQYL